MFKSRTCLFSVCTPNTIEWTTKKQIQLMLFGVKTHSQITDYGCSIVHMVRQAASQTKKTGESFQQVSTCFNIPARSCRYIHIWLVALTILKNMKVNGKDYPIYYGKTCLKPPTNVSIYTTSSMHG